MRHHVVSLGAFFALGVGGAALATSLDERNPGGSHSSEWDLVLQVAAESGLGEVEERLRLPAHQRVQLQNAQTLTAGALHPGDRILLEEGRVGRVASVEPVAAAQTPLAAGQSRVLGVAQVRSSTAVFVVAGDERIETTPEHRFFVEQRGWVRADELRAHDRLRTLDGEEGVAVRAVEQEAVAPRWVYNLIVEGTHTFRVGRQGIWVHNGSCAPLPRGMGAESSGRATAMAAPMLGTPDLRRHRVVAAAGRGREPDVRPEPVAANVSPAASPAPVQRFRRHPGIVKVTTKPYKDVDFDAHLPPPPRAPLPSHVYRDFKDVLAARVRGTPGGGGIYRGADGKERYVVIPKDPTTPVDRMHWNMVSQRLGLSTPNATIVPVGDKLAYAVEIVPGSGSEKQWPTILRHPGDPITQGVKPTGGAPVEHTGVMFISRGAVPLLGVPAGHIGWAFSFELDGKVHWAVGSVENISGSPSAHAMEKATWRAILPDQESVIREMDRRAIFAGYTSYRTATTTMTAEESFEYTRRAFAEAHGHEDGPYRLLGQNCLDDTHDVLRSAGFLTPKDPKPSAMGTPIPNRWFDDVGEGQTHYWGEEIPLPSNGQWGQKGPVARR